MQNGEKTHVNLDEFVLWAKQNLNLAVINQNFEKTTPSKEKELVFESLKLANKNLGDSFYVISQ